MSAARRASSQLLSSRSVHLRIQPRPANLTESREIYRVLQRFGEISTYKYLRYEYHNPADNIALAIYRDVDSAQRALNASPIRFALERVSQDSTGHNGDSQWASDEAEDHTTPSLTPSHDGIDEMLRPSQLINRSLAPTQPSPTPPAPKASPLTSPPAMPFETALPLKQTEPRWFQVTVDRSRVIHQDYVERQPYWKQFQPTKSMAQQDLAKVVPHIGLSDVSKRPPNAHRTPNKVLRQMSHYVENYMPTLRKLYEEGGREKSENARQRS